jgi:alkylhydroperoxidase family enzyme
LPPYYGKKAAERQDNYAALFMTPCIKLTATPWAMTAGDLEPMRAAGLSEVEMADVNYICGYFNLMNRLALGLGVEPHAGMPIPPVE